jgi:hypothetical protein
MKGVLFSTDFIRDKNGNIRLLELNTDTAVGKGEEIYLDWSEFILKLNGKTDLYLQTKPHHDRVVKSLKDAIIADGTFTGSIHEELEDVNVIYPTYIEDSDDIFILRMAYDESALLDSTYAKSDLNTLKLFRDNSNLNDITGFYYSGSSGVIDELDREINEDHLPDFTVKKLSPQKGFDLKFYKVGNEDESDEIRTNSFLSSSKSSDVIIKNYYQSGSSSKVNSIRSYQITYTPDLSITHLGQFEQDAYIEYTTSSLIESTSSYNNAIPNHLFHSYATTGFSEDGGIGRTEYLLRDDGGGDIAPSASIGTAYDSLFISGSPDTDDGSILHTWSHSGKVLPAGSYNTGSILYSIDEKPTRSNVLRKFTFDNGTHLRVAGVNRIVTYQSSSDSIKYLLAAHIESQDSVFRNDGSLLGISSIDIEVYDNEFEANTFAFNLEDVDTFVTSGSNVVLHNGPCFVAGTKIAMDDGTSKNIENVVVGDRVVTLEDEDELVGNRVLEVMSKANQPTVKYTLSTGGNVEATLDHPIFVKGKGYCSYSPSLTTQENNGMNVNQIEIGDSVLFYSDIEGTITSIELQDAPKTVYNLRNVENNHNFFANGILVHNRIWGPPMK